MTPKRRDIALAALKAMIFPGYRSDYFWGWRSAILIDDTDFRSIQDGSKNSIVSACVQWIARTFPEAPPALWEEDALGVRKRVLRTDPRARMLRVMRFPTVTPLLARGYYSGVSLWQATLASRVLDGNAYWIKGREPGPFRPGGPTIGGKGAVTNLWYVPHYLMEPRWPEDGKTFISHYEMTVNGEVIKYPVQDVVHFRHGLDPENVRKGLSPLHALMREVFTDEQASRFSAAVLKNHGIPGMIVSPDTGNQWRGSDADVQTIKQRMREEFTGDQRGEPLIFNSPTKVQPFGFTPQELDLSAIRNVPEERITAAVGLPAAVVGFGTGLKQTKVGATMAELRDQAWQSNLIPTQREMAEEIAVQLMPDFGIDTDEMEFGFDISRVAVLQEHRRVMSEVWGRLAQTGIAKRSECRTVFELPSGPDDDVYIPGRGMLPVAPDVVTDANVAIENGNKPPTNMPADQLPEAAA